MSKITSADVSAWLVEQLAKAHEYNDYAHINLQVHAFKGTKCVPYFKIYLGTEHNSQDRLTIEECFADLDGETPRTIADRLLEKAAALTSEANKILAKAQP